MPLRVVCFVAMLALTGSADLGEATPAELTAVGLREEDETGDDEADDNKSERTTETVSSRQLRRILKILIPRENTWHRPS